MAELSALEQRCVAPFYLKMMGLNALRHDGLLSAVREVARETTDSEVAELLALHWRPRVMGAWLASGRARRVEAALLESLETSHGTLTAPVLATVALHGLGKAAVRSLKTYLLLDLEHQWGAGSFVAAVLERLDAAPPGVAIDDEARANVGRMLIVAQRLAEV